VIEGAALASYIAAFTIARLGIGGANLPLPRHFVQSVLVFIFSAAGLGLIGLFGDGRRLRAVLAITLLMPLLIVIGVLAGNF
jgi:hypothetical protein